MKNNITAEKIVASVFFLVLMATMTPVDAQQVRYKMTTDIPASITTPDSVQTSLGMLRFFDGFPDDATVQKLYDNLDFQRGVQVFLTALPAAASHAEREGFRTFGPDNQTVLVTESFLDSHSLFTIANGEVIYNLGWLDIKDGPLVMEIPPDVLGFVNDFWGRHVGDIGRPGPDHGKGGKYLLLPPDYTGLVPEGYFVMKSRTYGNSFLFRSFDVKGDLRPAIQITKERFRLYPLALAAYPPRMKFVNISGKYFSNVPATDFTLFENVATVIREEPQDAVDPEVRGLLASIGIRKDKPFEPDNRMKAILADAAKVGNATGRAIFLSTRDQDAYYYPNSAWKMGWIGNDPGFSPGGLLNLDARTLYFYATQGVSPAMTWKLIGMGSQYAYNEHDAEGNYLDGTKTYRLRLPPDIPAREFWAVTIYDSQTRAMLQTDQQFPEISNKKNDVLMNPDGSVDLYFGPEPPAGKERNWIQTIPGKGWWTCIRLYGPLEPWFDKTWQPGEIELKE